MAAITDIFVPKVVKPITLDPLSKPIDLELYLQDINDAKAEDLLKYSASSPACLAALHVYYGSCMIAYLSVFNTRKEYDASREAIEIRREKMDNARRRCIEEEKNELRAQHAANVD